VRTTAEAVEAAAAPKITATTMKASIYHHSVMTTTMTYEREMSKPRQLGGLHIQLRDTKTILLTTAAAS
jgi:hypothetical protein